MGFLTDPNGFFMELLRKISDIVFCNVLFCVLSLPVITAGAAMTGLSAAMQLIAEDKEDEGKSALRVFWQNFKDHFLRATLLWLSGLLGIAFLLLYYHTVNSLEGGTQHLYRITFYALVLVFFAGYQYVFPMLARFGQTECVPPLGGSASPNPAGTHDSGSGSGPHLFPASRTVWRCGVFLGGHRLRPDGLPDQPGLPPGVPED